MRKALLLALGLACLPPAAEAGTFSRGLEAQVDGLAGADEIKVLVVLQDQADIPAIDWNLHVEGASRAVRHRTVVEELKNVAQRSQPALLSALDAKMATGEVAGYTPHWLINAIVVVGTVDAIREISRRPDVEVVEANLEVDLIGSVDEPKERLEPLGGIGITPGVQAIQADRVWYELGIDGTGTIVANMDTGVDYTHPALNARWRGHFAPVGECWHDALGGNPLPSDSNSHGTHVMGTITGQAPSESIGVAPGALWIADNSINQGAGPAFDNDVLAGYAWFTDPDGDPGTLDDVPDVVQNSWRVNEFFSGYVDCDSRWWAAIDACEAAGVVTTWSAGNEGPGSETIGSPADRADGPYNTFSVGATIHSPPYTIASFSSRGPSGCGGADATKPEISAPGESIYSSEPGGIYDYKSGTSMSGPHVAGVVALMRSANPNLDVITIKQIIMDTATDLGQSGEDNIYGHGFINAYDAVLAALSGYGTAEGYVTDANGGAPIEGALVSVSGDPRQALTDASGFFQIHLPEGNWDLDYSFFGYADAGLNVNVTADNATDASLSLSLAPQAPVSGRVRDYQGNYVAGATVSVLNTPLAPAITDGTGWYQILVPDQATYTMRAYKVGFGADERTVSVNGPKIRAFVLPELLAEDFESGNLNVWPWELSGNALWFADDTEAYEGQYSARSGDISNNQTSTAQLTVTLAEAGDLSFWYKISTEANYDYLRFYVDGALRAQWAGFLGWAQYVTPVTAGEHTFRWTYDKDFSVSSGADAVWVDFIEMPAIDNSTGVLATTGGPSSFALGRPSPNPFDATTSISFDVPAAGGDVSIAVFDVGGRLVQTLVSGPQPGGRHSVRWDGRDATGRAVASGVYFYRMDAGELSRTEKVTLLR